MKKIRFISVLLILSALLCVAAPVAVADNFELPDPVLAQAVLLAEVDTGMVLYEMNANARRAPDSLVKIMTLLLAAEAVSRGDIGDNQVLENLRATYIGNDDEAADAVAIAVAGSVEAFVDAMNARAAELGCRDTNFVNATGALDARHYTTASDLFLIARAGLGLPVFIEVAGAAEYKGSMNSNRMLVARQTKYYYKYCVFGKVSATYDNGYGAVEYAERDGMKTIVIVLGAAAVILESDNSTEMQNLTEARRLLEWGHKNYSWRSVISGVDLVARAAVDLGDGADFVNLRPAREFSMLLRRDLPASTVEREIRIFSEELGEPLVAPVTAGTELGELILLQNGRELDRIPLVADTGIQLQRVKLFTSRLRSALSSGTVKVIIAVAAVLFVIYIGIVVRYQILRARYVKARANAPKDVPPPTDLENDEEWQ